LAALLLMSRTPIPRPPTGGSSTVVSADARGPGGSGPDAIYGTRGNDRIAYADAVRLCLPMTVWAVGPE